MKNSAADPEIGLKVLVRAFLKEKKRMSRGGFEPKWAELELPGH